MDDLLVVVGHGTGSTQGDAPLHDLVLALSELGLFEEVRAALLNGRPSLADAVSGFANGAVHLLPFLMSGGVNFQRRLADAMTNVTWQQRPLLYQPLGFNPAMAALLAGFGKSTAIDLSWDVAACHLLLIGHGTLRDPTSAQAARLHQQRIAAQNIFARVDVAFLDQPPRLDNVLADHINSRAPLLGIGLFAGAGRHGGQDMTTAFAQVPRRAHYCGAIGAHPELATLAQIHLKQVPLPVG
jgi:sirohydrochlorin cobaltochelatase